MFLRCLVAIRKEHFAKTRCTHRSLCHHLNKSSCILIIYFDRYTTLKKRRVRSIQKWRRLSTRIRRCAHTHTASRHHAPSPIDNPRRVLTPARRGETQYRGVGIQSVVICRVAGQQCYQVFCDNRSTM